MSHSMFEMSINSSDGFGGRAGHPLPSSSESPMSPGSYLQSPSAPSGKASATTHRSGSGGGNRKGNSAERRATHNAIERARRESLNGRFLQLAATLPAISDVRRPSKSLIVNKSLDFVSESMSRETMYRFKIDNLRNQNDQLRDQLNKFRAQAGLEPIPPPPIDQLPPPMSEAGGKRRSNSLTQTCVSVMDRADFEDDCAGSEGELTKPSPVSPASVMTAKMPMSSSLAAFPAHTPHYSQASGVLQVATGLPQCRGSPTASCHSDDLSSSSHTVADATPWMPNFGMKNMATSCSMGQPHHGPSSYADFPYGINMVDGGESGAQMAGYEPYMASNTAAGMHGNVHHVSHMSQAPSPHTSSVNGYGQVRTVPQQPQMNQFTFDQSHHQSHHQGHHQGHHFFDQPPLQPTTFMTAV